MRVNESRASSNRSLHNFGAIIALALMGSAVLAQLTDPLEILRRSVAARGSVNYAGVRTVVMFEKGVKIHGVEQQVHCQAPDKLRIMIINPPSERGKLFLANGQEQWECDPYARRALRTQLPPPSEVRALRLQEMDRLGRSLRLQFCGAERIAGREAYVVKIYTPQGLLTKKIWIDAETFVILKTQRFDSRGRVKASAYFTRINYNPQFGPGLFTFCPPADCAVIEATRPPERMPLAKAEQRAGFRAVLPTYLPPGYRFQANSVAVIQLKGRNTLWLSFTNGVDTFSLFQGRGAAPVDTRRRGGALTWKDGGFHFTLVGPLSTAEMQRVRASIRP